VIDRAAVVQWDDARVPQTSAEVGHVAVVVAVVCALPLHEEGLGMGAAVGGSDPDAVVGESDRSAAAVGEGRCAERFFWLLLWV
jgi:hypothetical protein